MKLHSAWCRLTSVFICCCLLVLLTRVSHTHPIENSEHALRNMQQIPQWHCLRYRRFDLVKRCRNYRVAQISAHHEPSESHHTQRITPVAARPLIKVLAEV
ncbi:uncharacterized protein LOC111864527 [Cryptotermes secundus]|uniref:uncharacterized protein LOC111864527 n=1 Tax=Cryptotermes secundus TaxID=105785 RepID=UPI000CD7ADBD|nr:uncharacterized protein LOC111864527 [Cryptotermes secundus]